MVGTAVAAAVAAVAVAAVAAIEREREIETDLFFLLPTELLRLGERERERLNG